MKNKTIFKYHSWLGLITGLYLIIMGISGAILVFHDSIDQTVPIDIPAKIIQKSPDYDRVISVIQHKYPLWEIRLAKFSQDEALIIDLRNLKERRKIFVDPFTSEIIEDLNYHSQFTSWLLKFHYSLHAGIFGRIAILLFGILYFFALVTGIYLYRKSILKTLIFKVKIKNKNKRNYYSGLHHYIGVWSLFLNIILVITGIVLSFKVSKAALNSPLPPASPKIVASVNEILHNLHKNNPEFTPTYIRLPKQETAKIMIYGKYQKDAFYFSEFFNSFHIDYKTGKILSYQKISDASILKKLDSMVTPFHYGEFGGIWIKILYSFIGLSGPFLSITGFYLWWKLNKN
ncbi:MAG TPA: PepSY-associated TM helix domain-containing protein [Flavobacteriaceae bacterium]|nr:PepSY domain-containing protein [Flavobacteriaceae bacterium]HEX5742670.1 PepSY-associated TM helix domain-containing protein [Flavobacteriaceae bacterium]